MLKIPKHVQKYLWDVNVNNLSDKDSGFIIERVLEYGDLKDFSWLKENFKDKNIISVLKKSKRISPKTGSFFALYFDIPKQELLCIQKPFTQKQNRF